MDIKKIEEIIKLVTESGISELEISEGEDKLRISTIKPGETYSNTQSVVQAQQPIQYIATPNLPQTEVQIAPQAVESTTATHDDANYIKSPMVGTFYRAASPTSASFVEVGQEVKVGQVLCIIEAMKLMNQIESEKSGTIKEILIKDGSPVEFGQRLFVIA
ncbi:MAG: acetyl-CoA carboxylase biotin carboxyl carrier protein [Neisseriaceae bacterium]